MRYGNWMKKLIGWFSKWWGGGGEARNVKIILSL